MLVVAREVQGGFVTCRLGQAGSRRGSLFLFSFLLLLNFHGDALEKLDLADSFAGRSFVLQVFSFFPFFFSLVCVCVGFIPPLLAFIGFVVDPAQSCRIMPRNA